MVERSQCPDEIGNCANACRHRFIRCRDAVVPDVAVQSCFVNQAVEHLLTSCLCLGGFQRSLSRGRARDVAIVALEQLNRNFLATNASDARVGIAAENVCDAPHAETEREQPEKKRADPGLGVFPHFLKHGKPVREGCR